MSARDWLNKYHVLVSSAIISILYGVGIFQICFLENEQIIRLTPLLLIISFFFLYTYTYEKRTQKLMAFAILFILGVGIEMIGVNTGFPFGEYTYGPVLGYQIFDTPWIIGINWILVIVAAHQFAASILPLSRLGLISAVVAAITVALDILIEPVAVHFDMWQWQNDHIPLSNYGAWFVLSYLFSYIYGLLTEQRAHIVVILLLIWLFIFFGLLNLCI